MKNIICILVGFVILPIYLPVLFIIYCYKFGFIQTIDKALDSIKGNYNESANEWDKGTRTGSYVVLFGIAMFIIAFLACWYYLGFKPAVINYWYVWLAYLPLLIVFGKIVDYFCPKGKDLRDRSPKWLKIN